MFNILILAVGKIKNKNLSSLADEYLKRLKPYAKIEISEIQARPFSDSNKEKTKTEEGEKILKFLEKHDSDEVFLLHEGGEEFDSRALAKDLDAKSGRIIFVIAGTLGFGEEVLKKYKQISLSQLTFTHEMARVLLFEQIYRASAIISGKEYHY